MPIVALVDRGGCRIWWEFKKEDCWVGVFWKGMWESGEAWDEAPERWMHVWICLVPCLPLHLSWRQ